MNKLLKDQIALVTGGTAGIGRAIAMKFASEGASVCIWGTNQQRAESALKELFDTFPEGAHSFQIVDVASFEAVDKAMKELLEKYGRLDTLVNNAGITKDCLLLKMSESDWDRVLDVNAKSCFNTAKAVIRAMMKQRSGKIINVSSVIGLIGNPGQINYAASKAAVIGFTKALAKEVASRKICVNCLAPGYIETSMTEALPKEQTDELLKAIPLGRIGKPEEIADAAVFLASKMADYITGQVLTVDGGMVM